MTRCYMLDALGCESRPTASTKLSARICVNSNSAIHRWCCHSPYRCRLWWQFELDLNLEWELSLACPRNWPLVTCKRFESSLRRLPMWNLRLVPFLWLWFPTTAFWEAGMQVQRFSLHCTRAQVRRLVSAPMATSNGLVKLDLDSAIIPVTTIVEIPIFAWMWRSWAAILSCKVTRMMLSVWWMQWCKQFGFACTLYTLTFARRWWSHCIQELDSLV